MSQPGGTLRTCAPEGIEEFGWETLSVEVWKCWGAYEG